MKRRTLIILVVVLLIAAAGAGAYWAWITYGNGGAEEEPLGGSGTVEANEVAISSVIAGQIAEAPAEEGAEVTSGTVLFTLNAQILQLQVEQADAGLKAAEAALAQARADGLTQAEIDQAQARVDQASAAKQMAEVQLAYATISSPKDGVVTQVTAAVGETASPGKTLATVADLNTLYVSIYVAETRIGEVTLGQKATVSTDSSDVVFDAEVVFIATTAEFTPSNIETEEQRVKLVYEVRLQTDDTGGVLKPGMPVNVEFE